MVIVETPIFTKLITNMMSADEQRYMLYAFPKNAQENLTDAQLKSLRIVVERWSQ
jgi:hypothetical protein